MLLYRESAGLMTRALTCLLYMLLVIAMVTTVPDVLVLVNLSINISIGTSYELPTSIRRPSSPELLSGMRPREDWRSGWSL